MLHILLRRFRKKAATKKNPLTIRQLSFYSLTGFLFLLLLTRNKSGDLKFSMADKELNRILMRKIKQLREV